MKKLFVLLAAAIITTGNMVYAGGIMTNTNQSASYIRMPVRDASLGIDAVYFNPAGTTALNDGLHLSLSNQFIFQERYITNTLSHLKDSDYTGGVSAPLFPSIYAAYKTGNFVFSAGFNPIGGGGSAEYESGLPSFEMAPSMLVPGLSNTGVNNYRLDTFFEGSSIFFGYQGGVSYKINDIVSVFGGVRYVTANNSYKGYLRDIELYNFGGSGQWARADAIMTGISNSASDGATQLQAAIEAGLVAAGDPVSPQTAASLEALGIDPSGVNNAYAVAAFGQAAETFSRRATLLNDQEADVSQSGAAITPIFGLSLTLDRLNIGVKYEMKTELELENSTTRDVVQGFDATGTPITMFPDGYKFRNDMPAMLSVGLGYKANPRLNLAGGVHYYFDKSANYSRKVGGQYVSNEAVFEANYIELAVGGEYKLTDRLLVSAGFLIAQTGANQFFHTDMSHSLSSNNIGLGGRYSLNDMVAVNLGFLYSSYYEDWRGFGFEGLAVDEIYNRDGVVFAVGVDFSF